MRRLAGFNIVVALLPISVLAQATVEGRVGLPKSRSAPVVAKRYEIVTRGGALSTQPPLAVVYLAGSFPKLRSPSTKQIAQKDLAFVPSLLFNTPGLVTLRCDIHEHMRGLILVADTPYFVVTDADGRFRLSGLPSGRYTLKAWIDSKTTREAPVELKNGETPHIDFP